MVEITCYFWLEGTVDRGTKPISVLRDIQYKCSYYFRIRVVLSPGFPPRLHLMNTLSSTALYPRYYRLLSP
jgi:hypothetical protein